MGVAKYAVMVYNNSEGEHMGNKVKQPGGQMKRPMTRLPLVPKSSLGLWPGSGLLCYPHYGWEENFLNGV
jgi:hypothetical protein